MERGARSESQKDGSIVFEAEVAGTEEIKFWVMSWGAKALVAQAAEERTDFGPGPLRATGDGGGVGNAGNLVI